MKNKIKDFLEEKYNSVEVDYKCPFFGNTKAYKLNKEVGFNTGTDVLIQIEQYKNDFANLFIKFEGYSSWGSGKFEFQAQIESIEDLETLLRVIKW